MRTKKIEKTCKRKKCPYYKERTDKCYLCGWNPNAIWIERKVKK